MLPPNIVQAIEAFSDLSGIGQRSAERLVFNLLKSETNLDQKLGQALIDLKKNLKECQNCSNYSQIEVCEICQNQNPAEQSMLCVVESPLDLMAIHRTQTYKGGYQVLHGLLSPLNRIGPEELRISALFRRLEHYPNLEEIILAMPGNVEGDATAFYLTEKIKEKGFGGNISRLARGIPTGSNLDYIDAGTLSRAISERRNF